MSDRILVPIDGSAFSEQALPYAVYLARRCKADLVLAWAVAPAALVGASAAYLEASIGDNWAAAVDAAQAHLDRLAADLAAQGVRAETIVVGGRAADVVLERAQQPDVRLVVMATHGRSGPSRWLLGSVAEQVVRKAPRPVLLLTPRALAAGTPDRLRQRLLVATDGSAVSEGVFPAAVEIARCVGAPISLVQAITPATLYAQEVRSLFGSVHPMDLQQRAVTAVLDAMRPIVDDWRRAGVAADAVVEVGGPTAALARTAARQEAGWVALASHGRGGLSEMVLGSTASAVLRTTDRPVLLMSAAARPTLAAAEGAARIIEDEAPLAAAKP